MVNNGGSGLGVCCALIRDCFSFFWRGADKMNVFLPKGDQLGFNCVIIDELELRNLHVYFCCYCMSLGHAATSLGRVSLWY